MHKKLLIIGKRIMTDHVKIAQITFWFQDSADLFRFYE